MILGSAEYIAQWILLSEDEPIINDRCSSYRDGTMVSQIQGQVGENLL